LSTARPGFLSNPSRPSDWDGNACALLTAATTVKRRHEEAPTALARLGDRVLQSFEVMPTSAPSKAAQPRKHSKTALRALGFRRRSGMLPTIKAAQDEGDRPACRKFLCQKGRTSLDTPCARSCHIARL